MLVAHSGSEFFGKIYHGQIYFRAVNLKVLWSKPCLEGMLLDILGEHVPLHSSDECKEKVSNLMCGEPTEKESYIEVFPKSVLDGCRSRVKTIDALLKLFGAKT